MNSHQRRLKNRRQERFFDQMREKLIENYLLETGKTRQQYEEETYQAVVNFCEHFGIPTDTESITVDMNTGKILEIE